VPAIWKCGLLRPPCFAYLLYRSHIVKQSGAGAPHSKHTNMDVYDGLDPEDLMINAVIMASFAYHAAMRDELLPRKPYPPPQPRR